MPDSHAALHELFNQMAAPPFELFPMPTPDELVERRQRLLAERENDA